MSTTTNSSKQGIVEASNMAENASNPIPNTLAPSVSITGKRKASIDISDSATKKPTIEAEIEKHQTQAVEIQEQEDQYTCPCGAGCSEYDNDEDICANGCCRSCGGDDFESSGATFARYTNEEVTSYMIEYVGDVMGDKDVCTRINCCGYQTHGRNNDCLGLLCSYEYSKKEEADKEQLRKHCLGDGEVWAAPYRLFWPTDDGGWEEDSIVAQRLAYIKAKAPEALQESLRKALECAQQGDSFGCSIYFTAAARHAGYSWGPNAPTIMARSKSGKDLLGRIEKIHSIMLKSFQEDSNCTNM